MNVKCKSGWDGRRLLGLMCAAGLILALSGCGLLRSSGSSRKVQIKSLQESTNALLGSVDIDILRFGSRWNVEQAIATKHTRCKDDVRLQF